MCPVRQTPDVIAETQAQMAGPFICRPQQTRNNHQLLPGTTLHNEQFSCMYCTCLLIPQAHPKLCHYNFTMSCNKPIRGTRYTKVPSSLLTTRWRLVAGGQCTQTLKSSLWTSPLIVTHRVRQAHHSCLVLVQHSKGECLVTWLQQCIIYTLSRHSVSRTELKLGTEYVVQWTATAKNGGARH